MEARVAKDAIRGAALFEFALHAIGIGWCAPIVAVSEVSLNGCSHPGCIVKRVVWRSVIGGRSVNVGEPDRPQDRNDPAEAEPGQTDLASSRPEIACGRSGDLIGRSQEIESVHGLTGAVLVVIGDYFASI